jgi:hypothetical protein
VTTRSYGTLISPLAVAHHDPIVFEPAHRALRDLRAAGPVVHLDPQAFTAPAGLHLGEEAVSAGAGLVGVGALGLRLGALRAPGLHLLGLRAERRRVPLERVDAPLEIGRLLRVLLRLLVAADVLLVALLLLLEPLQLVGGLLLALPGGRQLLLQAGDLGLYLLPLGLQPCALFGELLLQALAAERIGAALAAGLPLADPLGDVGQRQAHAVDVVTQRLQLALQAAAVGVARGELGEGGLGLVQPGLCAGELRLQEGLELARRHGLGGAGLPVAVLEEVDAPHVGADAADLPRDVDGVDRSEQAFAHLAQQGLARRGPALRRGILLPRPRRGVLAGWARRIAVFEGLGVGLPLRSDARLDVVLRRAQDGVCLIVGAGDVGVGLGASLGRLHRRVTLGGLVGLGDPLLDLAGGLICDLGPGFLAELVGGVAGRRQLLGVELGRHQEGGDGAEGELERGEDEQHPPEHGVDPGQDAAGAHQPGADRQQEGQPRDEAHEQQDGAHHVAEGGQDADDLLHLGDHVHQPAEAVCHHRQRDAEGVCALGALEGLEVGLHVLPVFSCLLVVEGVETADRIFGGDPVLDEGERGADERGWRRAGRRWRR